MVSRYLGEQNIGLDLIDLFIIVATNFQKIKCRAENLPGIVMSGEKLS